MLDQIRDWLQYDLGVNFEEIYDAATHILKKEEEMTDIHSEYINIFAAFDFLT